MDNYWGMSSGAEGLAKTVAKHTGEDWQIYDGLKIFGLANEGDEKVLAGLREFTDRLAVQIYNLNIYPMRRKTPCFSYGDIRRVHRIYASN